jgi:hypothetical protein
MCNIVGYKERNAGKYVYYLYLFGYQNFQLLRVCNMEWWDD